MPLLGIIALCCVGLLFYIYIGYPLLLVVLTIITKSKIESKDGNNNLPRISMLIAAYNEEKVIETKINNCLMLNYPKELLDIWIASDGSSDGTNCIVRSFIKNNDRIHLLEFERSGKSGVLNKAINYIESNIIVFSDANTMYKADALRNLVKHFNDSKVGCVSGRLIYRNPGQVLSGKGESLYWRYETMLKKLESKLGYVAGANGAIYAIRRELCEPLPPKTINDDFTNSMRVIEKGYKCIYESNAIAFEDVAPDLSSEFKRHIRDGAGHYVAIIHLKGLLNPLLGIRSIIYWSHRILRWMAPFILIMLFILNLFILDHLLFKAIFILQVIFYGSAIIALLCFRERGKKVPVFLYVPFYFCSLNLALLIGFFKVITGAQKTTWERTERITTIQ